MKNLRKIDKELFQVVSVKSDAKVHCIAYVNNFEKAKKHLGESGKSFNEFPFISALGLELAQNELVEMCEKSWLKFVTRQTSVLALMNVAKKVLKIDKNATGKNVTICYIDTGIANHGDFVLVENRIIKFIDLISNKKQNYDDNGHGTFVAGVGSGNGIVSAGKFCGIAPKSKIVSIKALNSSGEASAVKILDAMQWVFDNHLKYNIRVVCMSFGSEPLGFNDPIMRGAEALWGKGIVVVAAAGNSGPEFQTIKSPGTSSKIITVGGMNDNRTIGGEFDKKFFEIATFSSRGPALRRYKPDVVAPAVNVTSCSNNLKELYTSLSGTSVATPMIAGFCALILEKEPNLPPDAVKRKLLSSCNGISFNRNFEGYGLPDATNLK